MMGPRYFLFRPTKKFSSQNEEKIEGRKWNCLIDENAHIHSHMSFNRKLLFFTFFFTFFSLPSELCLLFFFFFFFFSFDLLGRLHLVSVAHIYIYIYIYIFFSLLLSFVLFFFFSFKCDFFFSEHDSYFLINLGDCLFFWLFVTFLR